MAEQPYSPVQEVSPRLVPTPPEQIQTNPAQFGALTAQALGRLGQGLEEAGGAGLDTATRYQALFNEANVNRAQNDFLTKTTDLLYKPESAPGAGDGGFFSKRGDQAQDAYQGARAAMMEARQDAMNDLPNARQKLMFDQLTRRFFDFQVQGMGRHVDQQIQQAADQKTEANLNNWSSQASLAATGGDMPMFDEAINQIKGTAISWGRNKGYGTDWGQKWSQAWVGKTVTNAAQQMLEAGNWQQASALLNKYEPDMDKGSVLALKTHLKGTLEDQQANQVAQHLVFGTGPGQDGGGLDIPGIAQQITKVEGTGKNPASSAEGVGQFTDATWLKTVRAARPDLAGQSNADLLKMRGNPEFASSMTTVLTAQNAEALQKASIDPSPGNVYLAHFLGSDGAIKVLSADPTTPVSTLLSPQAIAANPTVLQGKTAADVSQWANQQMTGMSPRSAVKFDKARAVSTALAAYSDNPVMQRKVTEAINRQFMSVQLEATARAQAQTDANNKAANDYVSKMILAQSTGKLDDVKALIPQIAKDPNLTYQTRDAIWRVAEQITKAEAPARLSHQIATSLISDIHDGKITDMGPIYSAYTRQDAQGNSAGLTNADFNFVRQAFLDAQTPDGNKLGKVTQQFMQAVKPSIDKANPLMGQLDMTGGLLYFQLQQDIAAKVAQYRKDGKNPFDLFDPSKPDYVGSPKALAPYQKSIPESVAAFAARIQAQNPGAPPSTAGANPAPAPAAAVTPRQPGETPEQYLKRMGQQ